MQALVGAGGVLADPQRARHSKAPLFQTSALSMEFVNKKIQERFQDDVRLEHPPKRDLVQSCLDASADDGVTDVPSHHTRG